MSFLSFLYSVLINAAQNPTVRSAVSNVAAYAIRQGTVALVRQVRSGVRKPRSQFTIR